MSNPLIGSNLSDPIEKNNDNAEIYSFDCHNVNICRSYGEISFACLAGAYVKHRCSLGEKMQIRILNDANPNATFKPKKPAPPSEAD